MNGLCGNNCDLCTARDKVGCSGCTTGSSKGCDFCIVPACNKGNKISDCSACKLRSECEIKAKCADMSVGAVSQRRASSPNAPQADSRTESSAATQTAGFSSGAFSAWKPAGDDTANAGVNAGRNVAQQGTSFGNVSNNSSYGSQSYGQYGAQGNNGTNGSQNYGQYGAQGNDGTYGSQNYGQYGAQGNNSTYGNQNYGQYGAQGNNGTYGNQNYGQYGAQGNNGAGNDMYRSYVSSNTNQMAVPEPKGSISYAGVGKLLKCVFWMLLLPIIASFLENILQKNFSVFSSEYRLISYISSIVSVGCNIVTIICFLRLGSYSKKYTVAAVLSMIGLGISALSLISLITGIAILPSIVIMSSISLSLSLGSAVLGLISTLFFWVGNAEVCAEVNDDLATFWRTLWKQMLKPIILLFLLFFLVIVIPTKSIAAISVLGMFVAIIWMFVIYIRYFRLLWKTSSYLSELRVAL